VYSGYDLVAGAMPAGADAYVRKGADTADLIAALG
jgi:hypothetical protein